MVKSGLIPERFLNLSMRARYLVRILRCLAVIKISFSQRARNFSDGAPISMKIRSRGDLSMCFWTSLRTIGWMIFSRIRSFFSSFETKVPSRALFTAPSLMNSSPKKVSIFFAPIPPFL